MSNIVLPAIKLHGGYMTGISHYYVYVKYLHIFAVPLKNPPRNPLTATTNI